MTKGSFYETRRIITRKRLKGLAEKNGESTCLKCSALWFRNLDTKLRRCQTYRSFWDVDLAQDGEDQPDSTCKSWVWCELVHITKLRQADWIGHVLRHDCLLKTVPEGKRKEKGHGDLTHETRWQEERRAEHRIEWHFHQLNLMP